MSYEIDPVSFLATAISLLVSKGDVNDRADKVRNLVQTLLNRAPDKDAVAETLDAVHRSSVSPYDYDRLRFIFQIVLQLETADSAWARRGIMLLEIMSQYTRTAKATRIEIDLSDSIHSSSPSDNEKLRETRLPFHMLAYGDALKVITPELVFKTIGQLCPLAKLMPGGLTSDDFIVTLIQRELEDQPHPPSLKQVQSVIDKLENQETAVMVAKSVADKCELGPQKLDALKMAVRRSALWLETTDDKQQVERVHSRLESLYHSTLTSYHLAKHNFTISPNLTKALDDTEDFVWQLYETYLLSACDEPVVLRNLHSIAEDVCQRYSLDVEAIRKAMVQKWLMTPDRTGTDEKLEDGGKKKPETVSLSLFGALDDETEDADGGTSATDTVVQVKAFGTDTNLNRAIVLLHSISTVTVLPYLADFIFLESSTKITPEAQQRAFQALLSIASLPEIAAAASRTTEELTEHLLALHYTRELSAIGIEQSASALASGSNEGIIRSVWRKHRQDEEAVSLVANMAIDYGLFDFVLWEGLLQVLAEMRCWHELKRILVAVSGIPELWQLPSLSDVWKTALDGLCARIDARGESSDGDVDTFSTDSAVGVFVDLVLRSPFILQHDITHYVDKLKSLQQSTAAVVCCSAITNMDRQRLSLDKVLKDVTLPSILIAAETLDECTANAIANMVFDVADRDGAYAALLATTYRDRFVQFLVEHDRIRGLLNEAIDAGRIADAARVLRLYRMMHVAKAFGQASDDDETLVQAYQDAIQGGSQK